MTCGESTREIATISGIPCAIDVCARHAHGIGSVPLPYGGEMRYEVTRPTKGEVLECLSRWILDASILSRQVLMLPCARLLIYGLSIVDPGRAVQRDPELEALARMRVEDVARGNLLQTVLDANQSLRAMGGAKRMGERKRAESYYRALVVEGLKRGILIPILQRVHNAGREYQTIAA